MPGRRHETLRGSAVALTRRKLEVQVKSVWRRALLLLTCLCRWNYMRRSGGCPGISTLLCGYIRWNLKGLSVDS